MADAGELERWRLGYERRRAAREAESAALTDEQILARRIEESRGDTDPITRIFLSTTVPLFIEEMRRWSPSQRQRVAHQLGDLIAHEQGIAALCDTEARGTARKGELGKSFNAVARGLAILAYCPGGVVFAGHHWQAEGNAP